MTYRASAVDLPQPTQVGDLAEAYFHNHNSNRQENSLIPLPRQDSIEMSSEEVFVRKLAACPAQGTSFKFYSKHHNTCIFSCGLTSSTCLDLDLQN
jgi:hypothetical protein